MRDSPSFSGITWIWQFWWHAAGKLVINLEVTGHADSSDELQIDKIISSVNYSQNVSKETARLGRWVRAGKGEVQMCIKNEVRVHKQGQQAIYGLPPTYSSGGQCPCPCLKGVQLLTAGQRSNTARLRDMITVVSQLSLSQYTQSVTADQRHSSAV